MTGISASAKQGSVTAPTFCTSVANLADAICGITENATQVSLQCVNLYIYHCETVTHPKMWNTFPTAWSSVRK